MKYLTLIALSVFCISACMNINTTEYSQKIVIDRNTSENELLNIIDQAKLENITLLVKEKTYNDQGKLSSISGEVEFPNGGNGTFSSKRVGKITISYDLDSSGGGFSVTVKDKII